jgi:uncharacterized protein (DUF433 family)
MSSEMIHDRGRGPEIKGTRITVYNLLSNFLDPKMTETQIGILYDLSPEQVAAARAYVLGNADIVLAEHLRIEKRIASEVVAFDAEQAQQAKATFASFKEWLAKQEKLKKEDDADANGDRALSARLPSFREWLRDQKCESGSNSK